KLLSKRQRKPIFIRTFGNFDVFVNGKPIYFSSGKAKELLALLVDKKGGILTTEEALAIIWEDKAHNDKNFSLCRTAASRLRKTLNSYNIGHILVEEKAGKHLDTQSFDCDYYMTLKGNQNAENSFSGEYMSQYSWAEDTLAALLEKK
ncbi:MAG: hypothetical protein RR661_00405, partial [Anaerovoracaceae bacterium]